MSGHYEMNKPESREAEQVVDDSNDAGRVEGLHDDQKYKKYKKPDKDHVETMWTSWTNNETNWS